MRRWNSKNVLLCLHASKEGLDLSNFNLDLPAAAHCAASPLARGSPRPPEWLFGELAWEGFCNRKEEMERGNNVLWQRCT